MSRPLATTLSLLLVLGVTTAHAQRQVQETRYGGRILVNKEVNGERWAITYDEQRSSVTGNVLLPGGGAAFIDCEITTASADGHINLECYSAAAGTWNRLGGVALPQSFFGLGGACQQERRLGDTFDDWVLSYADSCGNAGEAKIAFDEVGGCTFSGITLDGIGGAVSDLEITGERTATNALRFRVDFFGACQGSASGEGSIVRWTGSPYLEPWLAQATVRGSTTCCPNLEAQIGFRY